MVLVLRCLVSVVIVGVVVMLNIIGSRGSGRTSRMLFEAVNIGMGKERFRKVKIFCTNPECTRTEASFYFNVHILNRLEFIKVDYSSLRSKVIGLDPKSYYVDHYVYVQHLESIPYIQDLIVGCHRYDQV